MNEGPDADAKDQAPVVAPGDRAAAVPEPAMAPSRFIVRTEVERVLAETRSPPDPGRIAAGWERRFIAEATRAEEMMQLYRTLGFEATADPVNVNLVSDPCVDCALIMRLQFKTIYTRRVPTEPRPDRPDEEDSPHA